VLQALTGAVDAISHAVEQAAASLPEASAASKPLQQPAPAATITEVAAAPAPAPAGTEVSGTGDTLWPLGGSKFASVGTFKGQKLIGLREFYDKDGKWMPGKKGISLSAEQFSMLRRNVAAISAAHAAGNASLSVELGSKRFVRINIFKGVRLVDVRQMYEKDGELKPGAKGLAMDEKQWVALTEALESIAQAAAS
jgi:Transcriptional Coactivator p15 (PC4)